MRSIKQLFSVSLVLVSAAACAGPQQAVSMRPGEQTPAAMGRIEVRETKDQNNALKVAVDHLPIPSDLDPGLQTYVLWAVPEGRPAVPLGQMQLDKDRSAELKTTIPFKTADLLVTAESTPVPQKPSQHVVLRGHIDTRNIAK